VDYAPSCDQLLDMLFREYTDEQIADGHGGWIRKRWPEIPPGREALLAWDGLGNGPRPRATSSRLTSLGNGRNGESGPAGSDWQVRHARGRPGIAGSDRRGLSFLWGFTTRVRPFLDRDAGGINPARSRNPAQDYELHRPRGGTRLRLSPVQMRRSALAQESRLPTAGTSSIRPQPAWKVQRSTLVISGDQCLLRFLRCALISS
jgi:hypothetical protein